MSYQNKILIRNLTETESPDLRSLMPKSPKLKYKVVYDSTRYPEEGTTKRFMPTDYKDPSKFKPVDQYEPWSPLDEDGDVVFVLGTKKHDPKPPEPSKPNASATSPTTTKKAEAPPEVPATPAPPAASNAQPDWKQKYTVNSPNSR